MLAVVVVAVKATVGHRCGDGANMVQVHVQAQMCRGADVLSRCMQGW